MASNRSNIAERCDRVRAMVSIEDLFAALNVDLPQKGRIRCIWPDHEDHTPAMQVYRDTGTVHCFACGKHGDIIEIAKACATTTPLPLSDALHWLETTFNLPPLTKQESLKGTLRKTLLHNKRTKASSTSAMDLVKATFEKVDSSMSKDELEIAASIKDYIWEQMPAAPEDQVVWAAWARKFIYGSYHKLATVTLPDRPEDIVDDSLPTQQISQLWDLHRGIEFPSLWKHLP